MIQQHCLLRLFISLLLLTLVSCVQKEVVKSTPKVYYKSFTLPSQEQQGQASTGDGKEDEVLPNYRFRLPE